MPRRAAFVLIGNELLTGKVQDVNLATVATEFFRMGIRLERASMIRDDLDTIASEVRAASDAHDIVLTSGGVGPTHDDMTVPGVARAFGLPMVRHEGLAVMVRKHFGPGTTDDHLRMALLPDGAELVRDRPTTWPVVRVKNVYLMPGVPEIFRSKFELVKAELGSDAGFHSLALYTRCDEGEIASLLERIEREFGVMVGSYPRFDTPDYKVKVTFDGEDLERCEAARRACADAIATELIVRYDPA